MLIEKLKRQMSVESEKFKKNSLKIAEENENIIVIKHDELNSQSNSNTQNLNKENNLIENFEEINLPAKVRKVCYYLY